MNQQLVVHLFAPTAGPQGESAYAAEDVHEQASALVWSHGGTAIPSLARYLLHAAKLRFLFRVWQRDATTHELTALIRSQVAGIREARLGRQSDKGLAEELRRRAAEARLMAVDLRELRQGVDIAGYNMAQLVSSAELLTPQGPFADDRNLAQTFLARLDDELRYLDIAAESHPGSGIRDVSVRLGPLLTLPQGEG